VTAEQAASMIEDHVYHAVLETIDMCFLWNLEERFARQFAARGARGQDMLRPARKLLADAFRRIADECERGWDGLDGNEELRDAYLDAVDAEGRGGAS
jgi:hypothetical protein